VKKVLVVSYYYPPIGGVGVIRSLKFSKYLHLYGWQPFILSVKNRDLFYTTPGKDEIPPDITVSRTWNIINNISIIEGGLRRLGVASQFIVPDAYFGWIPTAIQKGIQIIKSEKIDLIYVSCPPHSAGIIGARLTKATGVPLVVDFRDSWTINPYAGRYLTKISKNIDEFLEKEVIKNATYLIAATEGIQKDYLKKYPELQRKIHYIPNGFDAEDIPSSRQSFAQFTVLYTGYFYGSRTPENLFAALENIKNNSSIPPGEFRFLWAGPDTEIVHKLAEKYHLTNIVEYLGLVSKTEAEGLVSNSHLLYFKIGETDNDTVNNTMTGKIFSYIASGRPILAEIPKGSAEELIKKYSDKYYIIHTSDPLDLQTAIIDAYRCWKGGIRENTMSVKKTDFIKEFDFRYLTGKLADLFSSAAGLPDNA